MSKTIVAEVYLLLNSAETWKWTDREKRSDLNADYSKNIFDLIFSFVVVNKFFVKGKLKLKETFRFLHRSIYQYKYPYFWQHFVNLNFDGSPLKFIWESFSLHNHSCSLNIIIITHSEEINPCNSILSSDDNLFYLSTILFLWERDQLKAKSHKFFFTFWKRHLTSSNCKI